MRKSILVVMCFIVLLSGCSGNSSEEPGGGSFIPESGNSSEEPGGGSSIPESGNSSEEPGNGSFIPANESKIAADIMESRFFQDEYSRFAISDLTIDKRKTDLDNKSDIVYATAHVINENEDLPYHDANTIDGDINLIATYTLYNSGWILDKCEVDLDGEYGSGLFNANTDIELDEAELRDYMGVGDNTSVEVLDHGAGEKVGEFVDYSIKTVDHHKYADETVNVDLSFTFFQSGDKYSRGQWVPYSYQGTPEYDWHLCGSYASPDGILHLDIPYDQPDELMDYAKNSDREEKDGENKKRFIDTTSMSARDYFIFISFLCKGEITDGYAASFWDGKDKDAYPGMVYNDFSYSYAEQYYDRYKLYARVYLISPDQIICVNPRGTVDDETRTVYYLVQEVFPVE